MTIKPGEDLQACKTGNCLLDAPSIFSHGQVLEYLKKGHDIDDPVFRERRAMDEWLDKGRLNRNAGVSA